MKGFQPLLGLLGSLDLGFGLLLLVMLVLAWAVRLLGFSLGLGLLLSFLGVVLVGVGSFTL